MIATTIFIQLLTLVSGPLLARMLHVSGRGEFAFMSASAVIAAQVAAGGIALSVAQVVGRLRLPAWDVIRGNARPWGPIFMAGSAIAAAVGAAGLWGTLPVAGVVAATFTFTFSACLFALVLALLNGEQHVADVNIMRVISVVSYLALILVLFATVHPGPIDAIWVTVLTQSLGTFYGTVRLRGRRRFAPVNQVSDELRHLYRVNAVSGANFMVLGLDQLLVGLILGTASLGLYAVAITIANVTGIVLRSISDLLLPRLVGQSDESARREVMHRTFVATGLMALALMCALQIIASPLLEVAFGREFASALTATRILIVACTLLAMRRPLQADLQSQGHGKAASATEGICTVILIAAVSVGCAMAGLTGAAMGMLTASLVSVCALYRLAARSRKRKDCCTIG